MTVYNFPGDGVFDIDTYIKEDQATTNFGGGTLHYVGDFGTTIDSSILLKPTITAIPSNFVITAVSLFMTQESEDAGSAADFNVHQLLRAWTEAGVTWNKYDGSNNWTTGGAYGNGTDRSATVLATKNLSSTEANGEKEWSFNASGIALIQSMVQGLTTNNGFVVTSDGATGCRHRFYSSDDATPSNRPRFVVTGYIGGLQNCFWF